MIFPLENIVWSVVSKITKIIISEYTSNTVKDPVGMIIIRLIQLRNNNKLNFTKFNFANVEMCEGWILNIRFISSKTVCCFILKETEIENFLSFDTDFVSAILDDNVLSPQQSSYVMRP